jgi:mannose-6-phosphate isomerase class I
MTQTFRRSSQFLMPAMKPVHGTGGYDIYPSFRIGNDKIFRGLSSLASVIAQEKLVLIDGYSGIFFEKIKEALDHLLITVHEKRAFWINTGEFLKSEEEINELLAPSIGGDDPLFGRRSDAMLSDFFATDFRVTYSSVSRQRPVIIYGIGAALFSETGFLVYFDLPKNELQFRVRAGSVNNIGVSANADPKKMYRRFYFADWVVLNRHKKDIIERISIIADSQRPDDITWMAGDDLRNTLDLMGRSVFRARPWFEPGAWGGSWIRNNIKGLSADVPNYAWSFELITPENGLILESSGMMLECSFDFLMYRSAKSILGDCFERFGTEFPIRFDFLDTFDGGNLSVQVHPRPDYMKEKFGEDFTQEETYYILDTKDDAFVYLGFVEGIDRNRFREVLEESYTNGKPVEMEEFVQVHPASKHDLFLIPYGTIHGSGKNNLVLEISSTPYIFTFKMYDWLRPDLDGNPRPLNITRGMENLYFERSGAMVKDKLISKPVMTEEAEGWQLYHLPTHETHLYDIHRYHISKSVKIMTRNKCHVLSLVEGSSIMVTTKNGSVGRFNFAETFVIPAAAESYILSNKSAGIAMVVIAFVK